jgi:hypothetical protein
MDRKSIGYHDNGELPEFKAQDIRYFDPHEDKPPIVVKDKNTIYHNVFSFTNRIRVKAVFVNTVQIKQQLDECLLGRADTWYNQKLSHLQRVGLCSEETGVQEWCYQLESRFRPPQGKSLRTLKTIAYTIDDVCDGKELADYI